MDGEREREEREVGECRERESVCVLEDRVERYYGKKNNISR